MKKISATRISKLEFQIASLKKARKIERRERAKFNQKLNNIIHYQENRGRDTDRALVTRMEHAEKALKVAVTPWASKSRPDRYERYVKVSSGEYHRLREFTRMSRKKWETFRVLFLKEGK